MALAFDTNRHTATVAVLEPQGAVDPLVLDYLRQELRSRGLEAVDAGMTYDDALEARATRADYYVEVIGTEGSTDDYGGVGISTGHADVALGVLVSRLAAEVRVYDADTMELVASENFSKRNTALLPTAVGAGSRSVWAMVALPFVERAQYRSVARAVARDAAAHVASSLNAQ